MSDFDFHSADQLPGIDICPACNKNNKIEFFKVSLFNTCQSCGVFYMRTGTRNYTKFTKTHTPFSHFAVIGNQLKINTKKYVVSGAVIFELNSQLDFQWEVIFLYDEEGVSSSLMLNNGHATHFVASSYVSVFKHPDETIIWKDLTYNIFDKYEYTARAAMGELPIDVSIIYEGLDYIHPPYLLTKSSYDDVSIWEEGTYVEVNSIESEITNDKSNKIESIGIAPNQINKYATKSKLIFKSVLIFNVLWILFAIFDNAMKGTTFITSDQQKYESTEYKNTDSIVYNSITQKYDTIKVSGIKYTPEKKSDSAFSSPTFTLENYKSNLTFYIESDIVQNWLAIDIFLINEENGEMYIVSKDLEYYSGVTDGESWSEGSNKATAQLGGLSAGKYHLTYVPHFPEATSPISWEVRVFANGQIWSNLIAVVIISWIIALIWFIMSTSIEKKRWENSPYGKYK